VTDDYDSRARLHVGRGGGEPAGAEDVDDREQARDKVVWGNVRGCHQCAVGARDTQPGGLSATAELPVLAGGLGVDPATGAGIVRGEERADDELAGLDRGDPAADLLNDAIVLVAHRGRLRDRFSATVRPQVRPAHAGSREPEDGVRRTGDRGRVTPFE